ncbi:isoprenylcysteine carboxylmethyltransferase family protein [Variovorax sp. LjRoot290]|uniref:methyltransferase family protein n=1 Tax=unclassified Variovorax TaxID=663243 RepID=UPI003ECF73DB
MNSANNDYGLWGLVLLNSFIFVGFAYSFFKPTTLRDWRSFGAYSAFIVALFAEMYGFPLTIFLLSGWLGAKFPNVNLFGHEAGHLWWLFTGQHGNPHSGVLHILSFVAIFAGFALLSKAWQVLYYAQRRHELATAGPYCFIRHPQYVAFVLIMFGFLLQWPTVLTLAMFPVLVVMYVRLAMSEERDSEREFGDPWRAYAAVTPRFLPSWGRARHRHA